MKGTKFEKNTEYINLFMNKMYLTSFIADEIVKKNSMQHNRIINENTRKILK